METLEFENGEIVTLIEKPESFTIEACDWGAPGAFGARLEIGAAFCTRETAIKAFKAACAALDKAAE